MSEQDARPIRLLLPPPKGHTHLAGRFGAYPTADYRNWLRVSREMLTDQWTDPPLETYAEVRIDVYLGPRQKDAHNYSGPILDLLAGARVQDDRDAPRYGRVVHDRPVALADDRYVARLIITLKERFSAEPRAEVTILRYNGVVSDNDRRQKGRRKDHVGEAAG